MEDISNTYIELNQIMDNTDNTDNTYKIETCSNIIKDLFNEYSSNPYIINKINNYIVNLPLVIAKTVKEQDDKLKQREKINEEKEYFTSQFLQKYNYSYSPNTELFFKYDGLHFHIYNEDEIQYQILSSITYGQTLISIKHKIKSTIIKKIKEFSPISYIPESSTIQQVINNLYPSLFKDKDSAKYFLTIIGDSILRKNENLIYIISPSVKTICNEIFSQAYSLLGVTHIFNAVKYKYYDHAYSDCRLIMINENTNKHVLDKSFYKYMMDFFCVACHYSNRYTNADNFLKNCGNKSLVEHTLFKR